MPTRGPGSTSLSTVDLSVGEDVIRINAGGGDFVDHLGNFWAGDEGDAAGIIVAGLQDSAVAHLDIPIENTPLALWALYQTHRDTARPLCSLLYRVQVPSAGTWGIRLHFSEIFRNAAGHRDFAVVLNGKIVLEVDVFAEAGGKGFPLAVSRLIGELQAGDAVTLGFRAGTKRKPMISGFELARVQGSTTTAAGGSTTATTAATTTTTAAAATTTTTTTTTMTTVATTLETTTTTTTVTTTTATTTTTTTTTNPSPFGGGSADYVTAQTNSTTKQTTTTTTTTITTTTTTSTTTTTPTTTTTKPTQRRPMPPANPLGR